MSVRMTDVSKDDQRHKDNVCLFSSHHLLSPTAVAAMSAPAQALTTRAKSISTSTIANTIISIPRSLVLSIISIISATGILVYQTVLSLPRTIPAITTFIVLLPYTLITDPASLTPFAHLPLSIATRRLKLNIFSLFIFTFVCTVFTPYISIREWVVRIGDEVQGRRGSRASYAENGIWTAGKYSYISYPCADIVQS